MVGVAEWLRHLVVAQKTVGSNPTAHLEQDATGLARQWPVAFWLHSPPKAQTLKWSNVGRWSLFLANISLTISLISASDSTAAVRGS